MMYLKTALIALLMLVLTSCDPFYREHFSMKNTTLTPISFYKNSDRDSAILILPDSIYTFYKSIPMNKNKMEDCHTFKNSLPPAFRIMKDTIICKKDLLDCNNWSKSVQENSINYYIELTPSDF